MKSQAKFCTAVLTSVLTVCLLVSLPCLASAQDTSLRTSEEVLASDAIQAKLKLAGDNKAELIAALENANAKHVAAVEFLILNMPPHDLENLSAEFLTTNVKLAYSARAKAPWEISDEIFMNDVLPYANIDEPRDPWRKQFFKMCRPIVADCKTPGEAAQKLNATLFKEINVKYSTKRKRANQSPAESMKQGLASCTGLSIVLVDACRSVGIPARLVGIPSWKNKNGNHTWVEVWDDGWQFTGAAEPTDQGLNHTWFQGDAALADPDSKMHSIYAVSFGKTETNFPMVWSPDKRVYAENVTTRYIPAKSETKPNIVSLQVRVWNADKSDRETVRVEVFHSGREEALFAGETKSGTADMNDMLAFELKPNSEYTFQFSRSKHFPKALIKKTMKTGDKPNQLFEINFKPNQKMKRPVSKVKQQSEPASEPASDDQNATDESVLSKSAQKLISGAADEFFFDPDAADAILKTHPATARQIAWQRYLKSSLARKRKSDFDQNQVTFEKHLSPYTLKTVGKRPENGWPIFIAMHGGGGAPQRLNDSQWKHMQIYYKDQPQVTGYKYLALRAPNNTWNGFYDDYVYPLIENLIQQQVVFGDVDPNKAFIMGYSHGGYGAFAIGPKIADRFAAVHASAAAPTGGQTSAKSLRATRFTFMVGEKDTAYGRRERCEKFANQIKELGYSNVEFMYKAGFGHGGLPDRDMISEMYDHVRNPVPKHVTWDMTDTVVDRFFWLAVDEPKSGKLIDAKIEGNTIRVKTENCKSFSIFVDRRLIADPEKPIDVVMVQSDGERTYSVAYKPSFKTLCESIARTGDVNLAFDFEIKINVE